MPSELNDRILAVGDRLGGKMSHHWYRGDVARLFPTVGAGHQQTELRSVSMLLATMRIVREFGREMLRGVGAPVGEIATFTQPRFKDPHVRPDGWIEVVRGGRRWIALLEAKTWNNEVLDAQVKRTAAIVDSQGFNSLITLSNQLALTHVQDRSHHWSWSEVLVIGESVESRLSTQPGIEREVLKEFIRHLRDAQFVLMEPNMGRDWKGLLQVAKLGPISARTKGALDVARKWAPVAKLAALEASAATRIPMQPAAVEAGAALAGLVSRGSLQTELYGLTRPVEVTVTLGTGLVTCSYTFKPTGSGYASGHVGRLVRGLSDAPDDVQIVMLPVGGRRISASPRALGAVRSDHSLVLPPQGVRIREFTVSRASRMGASPNPKGNGSFVRSVADSVVEFVVQVARPLSRR